MSEANSFNQNLKVLSFEGERNSGTYYTIYFAIPSGGEAEATRELLKCLTNGFEIHLWNEDDDEGIENGVYFRRTGDGLSMKFAGHHWSSDWKPINEPEFEIMVTKVAPNNRGGHWSTQGSLDWELKTRPTIQWT